MAQGLGRTARRLSVLARSIAGSSSGTQGVQRLQRTQTRLFAMTTDEAQNNPDSVIGIITIFGDPTRVLFDSRSSRSFVSSSFALHVDWELTPLKSKLVVTTPLGERILCSSVFKGFKILIEGVVLKANLIPLQMIDSDVILGID